jgi:hypothetical protein
MAPNESAYAPVATAIPIASRFTDRREEATAKT